MAALGAGAKLVGNYSYKLNQSEIKEIADLAPDIILLVGGTDGGNEEVILHNARVLAESGMSAPVIMAGNKVCADEIRRLLEAGPTTCQGGGQCPRRTGQTECGSEPHSDPGSIHAEDCPRERSR